MHRPRLAQSQKVAPLLAIRFDDTCAKLPQISALETSTVMAIGPGPQRCSRDPEHWQSQVHTGFMGLEQSQLC